MPLTTSMNPCTGRNRPLSGYGLIPAAQLSEPTIMTFLFASHSAAGMPMHGSPLMNKALSTPKCRPQPVRTSTVSPAPKSTRSRFIASTLAHGNRRDGRARSALQLERLHDERELVDLVARHRFQIEVLQ